MKKLTYEFVKKSFEDEGYALLSKEYENNRIKLKYKCPKGHVHSISWGKWKQGHRCAYCFGNHNITYEFVQAYFERIGYTLISKKYISARTKLTYICPEGHLGSSSWDNFYNKNRRCATCAKQSKPFIKDIKVSFESEGYKLLSREYINAHSKLDYVCSSGHKHSMTLNNWKTGYRCPTCAYITHSGSGHPNWRGGISFEPYCQEWKDKEYKQDIRNRDGNKCLNPYCDSPNKNDLTIHHIDYNKKNCRPSNLITVCRSCNSKANTDRRWHKSWYNSIINRRYNYGN